MELNPKPQILFEDTSCLVISKPSGLLSQPDASQAPSLIDWARNYLNRPYVGLIHRLDRNTSGIMLLAKRSKSAQRLTASLRSGHLQRTYLGWLLGRLIPAPSPPSLPLIWKDRLIKDTIKNQVYSFPQNSHAQEAILAVKPLEYRYWKEIPITLSEFILETGRTHQIRVQAALRNVPLLGDRKYGHTHPNHRLSCSFPRIALHSWKLSFPHPISQKLFHFEDPLPPLLQPAQFKDISPHSL